MKRKVCKDCKIFIKDNHCSICNKSEFSENWQGRLFVIDVNKSEIAQKAEIKVKGDYAIKVR